MHFPKLPHAFEEVSQIYERHVSRDFGTTGAQEVSMLVYNGGTHRFSYAIRRLWCRRGTTCRQLLWITAPSAMAGTGVLIVEQARQTSMEVLLKLRSASEAIAISPQRFHEYVLGTDFTYQDLRFWQPLDRDTLLSASQVDRGDPSRFVLQLSRVHRATIHQPDQIAFDRRTGMLRSVGWSPGRGEPAERVLNVECVVPIHGVWTPRLIHVFRPNTDYRSEMVLERAAYGAPQDDTLLVPDALHRHLDAYFESRFE